MGTTLIPVHKIYLGCIALLCHQSTIKILMRVHLKELAKPYVTIWEIRTRLVLEVDLNLDISLGSLYTRLGLNQNIWLAEMIQRGQKGNNKNSMCFSNFSFVLAYWLLQFRIPQASFGSLGFPGDSLRRSFSLSCPLSPQVFK